jgi:hypothetical protein
MSTGHRNSNGHGSTRAARVALMVAIPLALLAGERALSWAATQLKVWNNGDTLTAPDLNGNFAALQSAVSAIPFDGWDPEMHKATTTNMSLAQALCVMRFGIWDATASTCRSPLSYGTALVPRTDSDGAAVSNCPTGSTPADCSTAMFLLNHWRLNPNRETMNGHAWCSGTVDPALNSSAAALGGTPGFWYAAGSSAPIVCPTGQALVIDQLAPSEFNTDFGRPSYPRPHLYCQPTTQTNPWMCVSTSLP